MAVYLSKTFATPEEFEAWIKANEHGNKNFLDNLCEQDKERWDNKACKMTVKDGKLQLLCENDNVLAETSYYQPDGDTACCDNGDGTITVKGIKNANAPDGKKFRVWVGTTAEYNAIRVKDPCTLYWLTDDTTYEEFAQRLFDAEKKIESLNNKNSVLDATYAEKAKTVFYKGEYVYVSQILSVLGSFDSTGTYDSLTAGHAYTADSADTAGHAETADSATQATTAIQALSIRFLNKSFTEYLDNQLSEGLYLIYVDVYKSGTFFKRFQTICNILDSYQDTRVFLGEYEDGMMLQVYIANRKLEVQIMQEFHSDYTDLDDYADYKLYYKLLGQY